MKEGEKANWALAAVSVYLLYYYANLLLMDLTHPDASLQARKVAAGIGVFLLGIHSAGLTVLFTGILSIVRRSASPVVGALIAIPLFLPASLLNAFLVLLIPSSWRVTSFPLPYEHLIVLPAVTLVVASTCVPKWLRKRDSNNGVHSISESRASASSRNE